jgi:hypothetical protein
MKTSPLLLVFFCLLSIISQAQTRGALPGEIYFASDTYIGDDGVHYGIFYSADNGKIMTLEYENVELQPGVMWVGNIFADATPGVIYNQYTLGIDKWWVSFDYGVNWEDRGDIPGYTKFFSGVNPGLIFKGNYEGFFKSTDYGLSFELLPITIICPFTEVGFSEPEFFGIYSESDLYYNFVHTIDYGQTFTEIPIDSSVAYWHISGQFPEISRGTESGELYLVSWGLDYHYKIYYSMDTGYTWTKKFESGYIDLYYWSVSYTAGRQPGSFYVFRSTLDPNWNHRLLYIDYSNDYGETFTTYFHELDSLYTSVASIHKTNLKLSAFPNPFSRVTTIAFDLPENWQAPFLNIYSLQRVLIRQYNIQGKRLQKWDGKDNLGTVVPCGVYLYNISYNSFTSRYSKLIFIH